MMPLTRRHVLVLIESAHHFLDSVTANGRAGYVGAAPAVNFRIVLFCLQSYFWGPP